MITFQTQKRKLSDLLPYPNNPRKLTARQEAKLKESLEKFDLAEIPVINTDGTIIAGHQRVKILKDLYGEDREIEVRVPKKKLSLQDMEELLIRDNLNVGEWDFEMLATNFDQAWLDDVGFQMTSFDTDEMEIPQSVPDEVNERGTHIPRFDDAAEGDGFIAQIVLNYREDVYEKAIAKMDILMVKYDISDYSDLIYFLFVTKPDADNS